MVIIKVKVDKVSMQEAVSTVISWLQKKDQKKYFITTPNLEFIRDAQNDAEFLEILNSADLAVPDSSRVWWLKEYSEKKGFFQKLLFLPAGILSFKNQLMQFDVVPGVDLMHELCKTSNDYGFTIGLLGGSEGVAERCAERLQKKYLNLKITFIKSGGDWKSITKDTSIPKTDILFVALGHKKQEKWIAQNLPKIPVKVAMGVGGSFNYISGDIPRAPIFLRNLGMEWFFRLLMEPWRIKRIFSLITFILGILTKRT